MGWFFKLLGAAGTNTAEVDVNSNVKVNPPIIKEQAGYTAFAGRVDDGAIIGTPRVNRGYVTEGQRLAVAEPMLIWDDTFNATAQNTGKYRAPVTTQTVTFVNGYAIINGGNGLAINTNSALQTYRSFPLFGKAELRCNVSAMITAAPQANCVTEMGLFAAVLPGAAIPTDGVFFRWATDATLRCVVNYNGTETISTAITSPSINVNHDFVIVCQTNTVLFYIDDVLQKVITLLSDIPGVGQPTMSATQPFTARQYIGGTGPSTANQLKISDIFITVLGPEFGKSWAHVKAGLGHHAYQGQNGGTMGSLANYANNANPTAAVASNTAALVTGLGGQAWETATIVANTDGILFSFQNPVGSATQTPRTLYITGVTLHSFNQVAMATAVFNSVYTACFGHTAVSLATGEAATTKAPRRIVIGVQQPLAAVNTIYPAIQVRFDTPMPVAPGEFIALARKSVGTVPATGVFAHYAVFDGYFE